MSCLLLCRSSSGAVKNTGVVEAISSSSSAAAPTSSPVTTTSRSRRSILAAADRSGAFPTSAKPSASGTSQSMTGMPPPTPIFEVASVVPGDDLLVRGNGAASGTTYVAQQTKTTGTSTSTSTTRYVRTTGLARHRSSSLPPPTPTCKNIALVTKSKAKAKARSVQGKQQYQQRRRSAPGGKTSSSRAVIHAGTKLPKPYTYEPLTHSTIETVPLNADYPAGSCTINHAVGPAEPRQFYHRFKSTYGRPELNGRHGQIGYYDFRRIGVDVVGGAMKMRGGRLRNNNIGRQKTIRSLRVGKPVRRSVGLSTLWAWDFPPAREFRHK